MSFAQLEQPGREIPFPAVVVLVVVVVVARGLRCVYIAQSLAPFRLYLSPSRLLYLFYDARKIERELRRRCGGSTVGGGGGGGGRL